MLKEYRDEIAEDDPLWHSTKRRTQYDLFPCHLRQGFLALLGVTLGTRDIPEVLKWNQDNYLST